VATERQERQQTINSQLDALRTWAEAANHDLIDAHVFRDEGYSGSPIDRPGLDALRDAVRDGEVDVVGVVAPDRLVRRYAYQVVSLEEFRKGDCSVEFLNTPFPTIPATSSCSRSRVPSRSINVRCSASASGVASSRRRGPAAPWTRRPLRLPLPATP
jgi:DNA invertase Pin-like site-specific DNA recombinase